MLKGTYSSRVTAEKQSRPITVDQKIEKSEEQSRVKA